MKGKTPKETEIYMTELVLPNDTNLLGNLLGGRLMHWVDIAGALAATRHARNVVATIQVDDLDFKHPIRQGEMVQLHGKITWVGKSSIEVKIYVYSENLRTGNKVLTNEAYLVFVALDENQNPTQVPELILETEEEKLEYERAKQRRIYRLKKNSNE